MEHRSLLSLDKDTQGAIIRYLKSERQRIVDVEFQDACDMSDTSRAVRRLEQLAIEGTDRAALAVGVASNDSAALDRVIAPVLLAVVQKYIDM